MKTIKLVSLLLLGIVVALTGCESEVENLESFNSPSKLVVVSYISPQDTVLAVRVQKTQPAIGKKMNEEQLKVKNATVTISSGNAVVALAYNPATDKYEADGRAWPVVAGKTYQLKVVTTSGTAEASCTIPATDGIEITELNTPYAMVQDYGGQAVRRYTVSYKWTDNPSTKNYYRTLAYKVYSITNSYYGKQVHKEGLETYRIDTQTDEQSHNGIMASKPVAYHEYGYDQMDKPFYIYAVLVVADRNYYLYHQSLDQQEEFNGNPFAEPALMYTNIKGGLGVFAGYNQLVAVKELQ